jgi:hypothetical protein
MALWDDLALNVLVEVDDDVELLWDPETQVDIFYIKIATFLKHPLNLCMQRHYFDFFMKSFSKLHGGIQKQDQEYNPWNEANPNPLSIFVNNALSSTNRTQYLVSNYSPGNN